MIQIDTKDSQVSNHKAIEINIIYTPGTVKDFSFFVQSLLKWTPASFRLVSNGCLAPEQRYLAKLCRLDPRLEFRVIPTKSSLPHGQALNYLQALTLDDHFCFMDSDIFATGDFVSEIMPFQSDHDGVFGGMPIWVKAAEEILPAGFRSMTGMFNRTADGLTLGSTFFAVYNNRRLTRIMQSTGVGFEEYRWAEIPTDVQKQINALGLAIDSYDTGKILNLLLLSNGGKLINLDIPSLRHIGGASFQVLYDDRPKSIKRRLVEMLPGPWLQGAVARLRNSRSIAGYRARYAGAPEVEFQLNANQRMLRRNPVRQYFLRLLNALLQGAPPLPPLITGEDETDAKARIVRDHLLALFEERYDQSGGDGA